MDAFVPTFASPLTMDPDAPVGTFAAAFHKGVIRRLGTSVRSDPDAARLYDEAVAPAAAALPATPSAWLPELGTVLSQMSEGRAVNAAAHAMIALHVAGVSGEWSCQIGESDAFAVQGHIFHLLGQVKVTSDGAVLRIVSDNGSVSFRRTDQGWRPADGNDRIPIRAPAFFTFPGMQDTYAQGWLDPTASGVRDPVVEWPPKPLPGDLTRLPEEAAAHFSQVFQVLAETGPYLEWIRPLFRGIAASPAVVAGRSYSSSNVRHPGVFSCVFPHGVEQLGEVTVHEMSHQYFLMLNAIFPLAEVDHDRLYFSSLKGSARTLDRVLLAYHASANMTLYWQDRIRVAGWTAERAQALSVMACHTEDLTRQLDTAEGLTEVGDAIFRLQRSLLEDRLAA